MILPNKFFFDHQGLIKQKIEQNEWIKKRSQNCIRKYKEQRLNLEKSRQHLELLNCHYEVLIFYVIHTL